LSVSWAIRTGLRNTFARYVAVVPLTLFARGLPIEKVPCTASPCLTSMRLSLVGNHDVRDHMRRNVAPDWECLLQAGPNFVGQARAPACQDSVEEVSGHAIFAVHLNSLKGVRRPFVGYVAAPHTLGSVAFDKGYCGFCLSSLLW
jgi:hypothetical protein